MTKVAKTIASFFMGKLYPLVLAVIITAGHLLECEMLSATVVILMILLQLCICDSTRPLFIAVATFVFQVTPDNSPANPILSNYYFTEWRLTHVIVLVTLLVVGLVAFSVRKRIWRKLSFKETRLLLPLLILLIAFSANGLFSETWNVGGLAFGVATGVFYLFIFLLLYLGISEEENERELIDYFTYIALVILIMMLVQLVHLFITGDVILDGSIQKSKVFLGWATCNPLGSMFVTLIPILFYGAMTKKDGLLYFIAATASLLAAISTCSRNALLFGTLTYIACLIIAAFAAPKKWQRSAVKILICVGAVSVIPIAIILWDKISVLFSSFLNQGADDNGRFHLWALALDQFSKNPVFGGGFFTLDNESVYVAIEVMPTMAHNTPLELLSSTGVVGLACYLVYRVATVMPLLDRPTLGKTMLGFSYLVIAVSSLLDVFVFSFYTMFVPMIAMAIVCRIYDIQCKNKGAE